MKDLLNPIRCLSSSWLISRRQSQQDTSVTCAKHSLFRSISRQTLIPVAALSLPVLALAIAAEPATAWQTEASIDYQTNPEVIPSRVSVQPVIHHHVEAGDTLWELAQQYNLSEEELAKYNSITKETLLRIGETLVIPVSTSWQIEAPQVVEVPLGGVGGAISSDPIALNSLPEKTAVSAVPLVINPGETSSLDDTETSSSALPIQKFLADVEELRANYEKESAQPLESVNLDWHHQWTPDTSGKAFSPLETSANESNPETLATAPIKVEFYNPSLSAPIGETVSPELPPLSSPDQYLPNHQQKFNGYIWPAEGVFTSGYGMRWGRMHRGIDIAAPIGTPIVAAAPGEVVVAGWSSGGYGNLVKLKHPDGSLTLYAHNNKVLVQKGQEVDQGQQIAEMGSTGRSTGPHLHFEIHPKGQGAKNPLAYLPKR